MNKLEGTDQFKKNMDKLSKEMKANMLRDALNSGAELFAAFVKMNIRSQGLILTSNLINSVGVKETVVRGNIAYSLVGVQGVIYGRIHEYGGVIKPKTAKVLSWVDRRTGERVFANRVTIPARPYMRPAIDLHSEDVFGAMADSLRYSIARMHFDT